MTLKSARVGDEDGSPVDTGVNMRPGAYDVVAFASEGHAPGDRENWYVLRRRGGAT